MRRRRTSRRASDETAIACAVRRAAKRLDDCGLDSADYLGSYWLASFAALALGE